jgi:hypothetical protein
MGETTHPEARGGATMIDPTTIPHGCLTVGDVVDAGTIEQVSMTAYRIGGRWVPFAKVHGAHAPAAILVEFGGAR